jgi:hypothetical protein
MLPSSTVWATSFVLSATSATRDSPINAAQLGADGGQSGAALGRWRLLHEAVAAAEDLGLVEHTLAPAGAGGVAADLAVHLHARSHRLDEFERLRFSEALSDIGEEHRAAGVRDMGGRSSNALPNLDLRTDGLGPVGAGCIGSKRFGGHQ